MNMITPQTPRDRSPMRVLIVDDRIDEQMANGTTIRGAVSRLTARYPLLVEFAADPTAAKKLIREQFFDLAMVDHNLQKQIYGRDILDLIRTSRPSCYRVLVTSEPEIDRANAPVLYRSTIPADQPADTLVIRQVADYDEVVENLLKIWDDRSIRIVDHDSNTVVNDDNHPIVADIRDRIVIRSPAVFQYAELSYLFRLIFLGRRNITHTFPAAAFNDDDVAEVVIKPMEGGRSRSLVLECFPKTNTGHVGAQCIVKIGSRFDGDEEIRRFNRYVRYYRSSMRRVELLGEGRSDTVTGLCYSFAGGGVGKIMPLEKLFNARNVLGFTILSEEFGPNKREWYKQVVKATEPRALVTFSEQTHFQGRQPWHSTLTEVFKLLVAHKVPDVPLHWLGKLQQRLRDAPCHSSVVHGDLNAGNLLISLQEKQEVQEKDDFIRRWLHDRPGTANLSSKTIMIDYRHTERGPVFIDFAHLALVLRMQPHVIDVPQVDIEAYIAQDIDVENMIWNGEPEDDVNAETLTGLTYEQLGSYVLGRLARRNFEMFETTWAKDRSPVATWRTEYAATCIMLALHLWKFTKLGTDIVPIDPNDKKRGFKNLRPQVHTRFAAWIYALSKPLLT